jgi:hypothetical protein
MESCEGNLEGLSLLQQSELNRQALELNLQAIEFMKMQREAAETAETKRKLEQAKLEMQEKGRKMLESMRKMFLPTGMWPVILDTVPATAQKMGIEISQELLDEYR